MIIPWGLLPAEVFTSTAQASPWKSRNAGSDPLLLLRAKESALESDMKAVKLEYDIFVRYLGLLDYAGGLARQGVSNHLREGLK